MRIGKNWTTEKRAEIDALCQRNWELFQRIAEIQDELDQLMGRKARRQERRSHADPIREQ